MKLMFAMFCFVSSQAFASVQPIIGGTQVTASDFISKTVVALVSTSSEGQALCTASLVAPDLAITAAHCVRDQNNAPKAMLTLIFGLDIRASSRVLRQVDRAEIPKEWNPTSTSNSDTSDVALIHFSGGMPAGFVPSDLMPFDQALNPGQAVILAGYGITDAQANDGEGVLHKTSVTVINENFSPTEVELDQTHGGGACHGDSGGPAYLIIGGHPYLFGITSRGGGECDQDVIYSKISAYSDWFASAVAAIRK
jgi:secreted trypsin-like serine protease